MEMLAELPSLGLFPLGFWNLITSVLKRVWKEYQQPLRWRSRYYWGFDGGLIRTYTGKCCRKIHHSDYCNDLHSIGFSLGLDGQLLDPIRGLGLEMLLDLLFVSIL